MTGRTRTGVQDPAVRHADGVATVFELSGAGFGTIHTLEGIEIGDTGLEALADDSIPQGTTISLGFQDPRRVAKRGAVTQCEPCEAGYRLVVSFIDEGESPAY